VFRLIAGATRIPLHESPQSRSSAKSNFVLTEKRSTVKPGIAREGLSGDRLNLLHFSPLYNQNTSSSSKLNVNSNANDIPTIENPIYRKR
jgi:hypothetical protein